MNKFIFPMILLAFISCANNDKGELLTIDVPKKTEVFNLSEIASEALALRLETTDECLMSNVSKIEATDKYYFILTGNELFMFDKEGKFIRQIGQIGRGPTEYTYLSTFAVDNNQEEVFMATDSKIICYNFRGSYLREIKFKKLNNYIDVLNGEVNLLASSIAVPQGDGTYNNITTLYRLDEMLSIKDSILVKYLNYPKVIGSLDSFGRYITDLGDKSFLFFPVLEKEPNARDTLYQIDGNKLKPYVKVRFEEAYEDLESFTMRNMYLTKKYLFAEYYIAKKNSYFFCYDMENERKMNMEVGFNDDILNTGVAKLVPLDPANGLMYFVKQANEVQGLIDGVDEFDNPVIVIVKLKE